MRSRVLAAIFTLCFGATLYLFAAPHPPLLTSPPFHSTWVEWTAGATTGDTCGSTAGPEDEVTRQKQWHAYWRNTCWDQSQPTWFEVHPLSTGHGECGLTGCYPVFQGFSSTGTDKAWFDGTATDYDFYFGICRETIVHHAYFEAAPHNDTDPPCPEQADCSNCSFAASDPSQCNLDGGYFREDCQCCVEPWSPIIVNLDGGLKLSNAAGGVPFDFFAKGATHRIAWPMDSEDAWLVLDRNGNGAIDDGRELFGNRTELSDGTWARQGFVALREFDINKDMVIDQSDPIFSRLALWKDTARDGITQAGELLSLSSVGIVAISVDERTSGKVDEWGNRFRYRAPVTFASGKKRFAYDVFLTHADELHLQGSAMCAVQQAVKN